MIALALLLLAPTDDPTPVPPPETTWTETLAPVLDCGPGTITYTTVHYLLPFINYDETGIPVWGDPVVTGTTDEVAGATYGVPTADCPDWVPAPVDDGTITPVWVIGDPDPAYVPPVVADTPDATPAPVNETGIEGTASGSIVWKVMGK